jgi:phosphopantothenate synthetase
MPTKLVNGVRIELTPEEVAALPALTTEAERLAAQDAARIERIKQEFDMQDSVNKVLLKISFLQENRIRVLEGQPEVTATQFRTWVDSQID